MSYDFLIVGTGSSHAYFGHPEWAQYAPGLKTLEDALDIRRRILLARRIIEKGVAGRCGHRERLLGRRHGTILSGLRL